MRYIRRDKKTGKVNGHFANPNPEALEEVADNHPEILAWNAERVAAKVAYLERKAKLDPEKLLARLEALEAKLK